MVSVLFAIGALAIGALVGWLLGARGGEQARANAESLRLQLDGVRDERDAARTAQDETSRALAALQADARHFDARMKDLSDSKDALIAQFREGGDRWRAACAWVSGSVVRDGASRSGRRRRRGGRARGRRREWPRVPPSWRT